MQYLKILSFADLELINAILKALKDLYEIIRADVKESVDHALIEKSK